MCGARVNLSDVCDPPILNSTTAPPNPEEVDELRRVLARWLAKEVLPHVIEMERADSYPTEAVEQMREFGLFGATIGTRWGGLGLPTSVYSEIVEQISSVWMSLTGVLNSHLMMARLIESFGTDEQRQNLLPLLASGRLRGGLALTEPTCGTDLQAIRMTAHRDGRSLCCERHKDLDHKRLVRKLPRLAR